MPHQPHRGGSRGRRYNYNTYRDTEPDPHGLDTYAHTHGSHRGRHQYGQNLRGGIPHNNRQRRNSTDVIHQYQSLMHPAIGHRYRDLKTKTHRLQTAVEEILNQIEELAPTEDHMDWSFSPGTVIYVPVPHPSVDLLSQSSLQSSFGFGPSTHSHPTDPAGIRHNDRTTTDIPPVHTEVVGTTEAYYPHYPPTTVPVNGYDQTFTNPFLYRAPTSTIPAPPAFSGTNLDGRGTTTQTHDAAAAVQAFSTVRLHDAIPGVVSTNIHPNGVFARERRPVDHDLRDPRWTCRDPSASGSRVRRRVVGDEDDITD